MNRLMNLPYEELIQDRCGVSKQMERLMESRNLHEFLDDLNAVKAAVEAWMDERGIPYGVFNPPLTDNDLWSARNNESVIRFIRRKESQNTETLETLELKEEAK